MFRRRKLSCRELVDLVTDYLEDSLSRRDRARFEAHLAGCPGCRAYLEQMRRTIDALGRLDVEAVPAPVLDELTAAFRGWAARE